MAAVFDEAGILPTDPGNTPSSPPSAGPNLAGLAGSITVKP